MYAQQHHPSATLQRTQQLAQQTAAIPVLQAKPKEDPLAREQREIEARRQRLEERRQRVLNPKLRQIGVDVAALNEQVRDKQARHVAEQQIDAFYDNQSLEQARAAQLLERQRAEELVRRQAELNAFQGAQQHDLHHRKRLQASQAQELVEESPVFLNFSGVDEQHGARVAAQQRQQADWIAAQIDEKQQTELQKRLADASVFFTIFPSSLSHMSLPVHSEYDATQLKITELRLEMEMQVAADRARRAISNAHSNQLLVCCNRVFFSSVVLINVFSLLPMPQHQERQYRDQQFRQRQAALDAEEMQSWARSALLNERIEYEVDPADPTKLRVRESAAFKGFTLQQRQAILDEQRRQQLELQQRRLREREEELNWAAHEEANRRIRIRDERTRHANDAQRRLELAQQQQSQARTQALKTQYLDKVVYQNPVDESYFAQFGTSCR